MLCNQGTRYLHKEAALLYLSEHTEKIAMLQYIYESLLIHTVSDALVQNFRKPMPAYLN